LADSLRLTRYAFAMRTMSGTLILLAAMLLTIPPGLFGQQTETKAVVVVSDQSGTEIAQAQIVVAPR
jgi:hypothetical protein